MLAFSTVTWPACVFVRNSVARAVLYDRMQHAIARDQTDDLLCDGSFGLGPKLNRFSSRSWRRSWRVRFIHCDILGGQRTKRHHAEFPIPEPSWRSFPKAGSKISRNKEGVTGGNSPYADRAQVAVFSGSYPDHTKRTVVSRKSSLAQYVSIPRSH